MNKTTAALLGMLRERLAQEPPFPDPEEHHGHRYESVAREHDEWGRHVAALRLLLGVRLVNEALDEADRADA